MSEGLDKTDYETLIHLVSQNNPPRCTFYQILIYIFLESVLYDVVHPELALSFFTPSPKNDEYDYQQLLMHKQSLSKVWNHLVPCPSKTKYLTKKGRYKRVSRHSYGVTSLVSLPEIPHDFCRNKMPPCRAAHMDS